MGCGGRACRMWLQWEAKAPPPQGQASGGHGITHQEAFEFLRFCDVDPAVFLHHLDVLHLIVEPGRRTRATEVTARAARPTAPRGPDPEHATEAKLGPRPSAHTSGSTADPSMPLPTPPGSGPVSYCLSVRLSVCLACFQSKLPEAPQLSSPWPLPEPGLWWASSLPWNVPASCVPFACEAFKAWFVGQGLTWAWEA